jgi:hypothetical protein
MSSPDEQLLDEARLRSALVLTTDELEYLTGLDLAGRWRLQPARPPAWWGWLSLAGVLAAFAAWKLMAPAVGQLLEAAARTGLHALVFRIGFTLLFNFGQALLAVATSPALTYALALLALLAVALLAWPAGLVQRARPASL